MPRNFDDQGPMGPSMSSPEKEIIHDNVMNERLTMPPSWGGFVKLGRQLVSNSRPWNLLGKMTATDPCRSLGFSEKSLFR